jgi:hypothetical protein
MGAACDSVDLPRVTQWGLALVMLQLAVMCNTSSPTKHAVRCGPGVSCTGHVVHKVTLNTGAHTVVSG